LTPFQSSELRPEDVPATVAIDEAGSISNYPMVIRAMYKILDQRP
jgi:hypothetical protein